MKGLIPGLLYEIVNCENEHSPLVQKARLPFVPWIHQASAQQLFHWALDPNLGFTQAHAINS